MLDTILRVAEIFSAFGGPAALIYLARKVGQLHRLVNAEPTLTQIAAQFRSNGGHTLKDTVDRIESLANEAKAAAAKAVLMTEQQNGVLDEQNKVLKEIKEGVKTVVMKT